MLSPRHRGLTTMRTCCCCCCCRGGHLLLQKRHHLREDSDWGRRTTRYVGKGSTNMVVSLRLFFWTQGLITKPMVTWTCSHPGPAWTPNIFIGQTNVGHRLSLLPQHPANAGNVISTRLQVACNIPVEQHPEDYAENQNPSSMKIEIKATYEGIYRWVQCVH